MIFCNIPPCILLIGKMIAVI
uniref:Uncharacterized protein n=1 Tax=Rhizophora mucronata TaxID=61149 RepID=A0A2P2R0Z1_RHIMU